MNYRTTRVKNSVDVKMTADCIECAHSYPNIGTYVLVSGDSDFIHVINSLRAIGKRVIIIGVSWSTSRRLADQVDGLILYDIDVDPEMQQQPEPVTAPANVGRLARGNATNRQQLADIMRVIEEIVRSERQAGRMPLLTSLKQRIMRRVPGFDEKKLGFSGFKKLLLHTQDQGNIKLVTVGLVDWVLMADEPVPEEALADHRTHETSIETIAAAEEVLPDEGEPAAAAESPDSTEDSDPETVTGRTPNQPEAAGDAIPEVTEDATEPELPAEAQPAALSPELESVIGETLAQMDVPRGPGDGQDGRRVSDLVIMADMLEHQAEVTHVAFNFLVGEICGALQQGLEAEHPEIMERWGGRTYSRTYVMRLLRELGETDVFARGWHQERNEETGRTRRLRTFNLNRSHPLVRETLVSHWGPDTDRLDHAQVPADVPAEAEVATLETTEGEPQPPGSRGHTDPGGDPGYQDCGHGSRVT